MPHSEEAGIHSDESFTVLSPYVNTPEQLTIIHNHTHRGLGTVTSFQDLYVWNTPPTTPSDPMGVCLC